jgi:hypothetical protein
MSKNELEKLLEFCQTKTQRKRIQALIDGKNQTQAAISLGLPRETLLSTLKTVQALAARKSYAPKQGLTEGYPEGYMMGKTTIQRGKDGEIERTWERMIADNEQMRMLALEGIQAMCADLPKVKKTPAPKSCTDELMAVYPLGDPHIGMLAWGEECGEDWDLAMAEEYFCELFDKVVKTTPKCKEAAIVNLGDYFHYDNMAGVTTRSGNVMDVDGRYAKMVGVGVKIMRQMIETALKHHEQIRVINVVGNHDDTGALWLSQCINVMYEREPRVTVDTSPTYFHWLKFGKNFIGTTHGQGCKMQNLPNLMASMKPKEWGESDFRYWLTGHIHHEVTKEYPGVVVRSFRTLAAKEAYAVQAGHLADRDTRALVFHREFGLEAEHIVNIRRKEFISEVVK